MCSNFTLLGQSLNGREESRDEASKGNQDPGQSNAETSWGKGIDKLTESCTIGEFHTGGDLTCVWWWMFLVASLMKSPRS